MSARHVVRATALAFALLLGAGSAAAIPAGGADPDTPGTSASVRNAQGGRTFAPGDEIFFTVGGYPAGETVNIKIDDGLTCGASAIHGACVVHKQRVGSRGSASGSFRLPDDITAGAHWLRFLASAPVDPDDLGKGYLGYTRRGGADFTIVVESAKPTATAKPTAKATTKPTAKATARPTAKPTAKPTATARPTATAAPRATTEPTPSATPSATPDATSEPSEEPTTDPTDDPSDEPTTAEPTTAEPTTTEPGATTAAATPDPTVAAATTSSGGGGSLALVLGAVVVLGGATAGVVVLRRRRS